MTKNGQDTEPKITISIKKQHSLLEDVGDLKMNLLCSSVPPSLDIWRKSAHFANTRLPSWMDSRPGAAETQTPCQHLLSN